jgi:hypothetical protein
VNYHKFTGLEWLDRKLVLRNEQYSIISRKVAGEKAPLTAAGTKAVVYKLKSSSGEHFALKVFHQKFALSANEVSTRWISRYSGLAGLKVCKRVVLSTADAELLNEPGLEWAILMPWIEGKSWSEILGSKEELAEAQCIDIANAAVEVFAGLENEGLTHADISSNNVFVQGGSPPSIELIDVEDMYHSGFLAPSKVPAGTPGYNHPGSAKSTYWNSYGDRFAGAVMLSEMLAWHNSEIRENAQEESFFDHREMGQTSSMRYKLMVRTLRAHSEALAELFSTAWNSASLHGCPPLSSWKSAMAKVRLAARRSAAAALGWTPKTRSYFDLGLLINRQPIYGTSLISKFTCSECGQIVFDEKGHKESCSHHPQNVKNAMFLNNLLDPIPTLTIRRPGKKGIDRFACLECGRYLWEEHAASCSQRPAAAGPEVAKPEHEAAASRSTFSYVCHECGKNLLSHTPTCSANPLNRLLGKSTKDPPLKRPVLKAPTCAECGEPLSKPHKWSCSKNPLKRSILRIPDPKPAPLPKCDECGNEIKAASDHSLICTKHPDYWRTRATRIGNVRLAPLSDELGKGIAPLKPSLLGFLGGERCPDCGRWIRSGSGKDAHELFCPKRFR